MISQKVSSVFGTYCKKQNVNNVVISPLICRSQKHLQNKVNAVNTVLLNCCKEYDDNIDKRNISLEYLAQDISSKLKKVKKN